MVNKKITLKTKMTNLRNTAYNIKTCFQEMHNISIKYSILSFSLILSIKSKNKRVKY